MKNPISNWLGRHRSPANLWLHMLGIPACFLVAPAAVLMGQWWLAVAFFVAGYALQFLGHLIEGNRSGEEVLFRRILGRR